MPAVGDRGGGGKGARIVGVCVPFEEGRDSRS
jgi:hypothetical protein